MLLIPLWPKERRAFPIFTVVLISANTLVFLISWLLQSHQTNQVDQVDVHTTAAQLAGALMESDSGVSEDDRTILTGDIQRRSFPSDQTISLFDKIQSDPAQLNAKARYEWDLLYPVYMSHRHAVGSSTHGSQFQRWGLNPRRGWMPAIITHQFLHDGWLHLLLNMLFLWIAAAIAEESAGLHILWMYLAGGVAAAFCQIQSGISTGQSLVGASGAIATLMGFCLITNPRTQVKLFYFAYVKTGVFDCPLWFFLPVWLLLQVLLSMLNANGSGSAANYAYAGHIGGFGFGVLLGAAWGSSRTSPSRL